MRGQISATVRLLVLDLHCPRHIGAEPFRVNWSSHGARVARSNYFLVMIEDYTFIIATYKAANHIGAHAAETNHRNLHCILPLFSSILPSL
jgi:hypothetical protein